MRKIFIILFTLLSLMAVAQNEVKRVAILETVDKLGTVPYLKQLMFRSNLTTAITNTVGYEGYDRADLKEILGDQSFQRTGMVSDADIKKIGEFTGAKYVLIAEAVIDGSDMFITAKIIDVETARVLRNSNQLMGTSASEMQMGSQKVAADLLGVSSATYSHQTIAANTSTSVRQSSSQSTPVNSAQTSLATTNPRTDEYVDLGLPSGTKWKKNNEEGYFSYDQAINYYGNSVPSKEQWEELKNMCLWTWTGEGYNVIGPNKQMIFMPVGGYSNSKGSKLERKKGYYWSSKPA